MLASDPSGKQSKLSVDRKCGLQASVYFQRNRQCVDSKLCKPFTNCRSWALLPDSVTDLHQNKMTKRCSDENLLSKYQYSCFFIFFHFEEKVNDTPSICHSVPCTSTKQYWYNMPPVALIFPSTWKSPRIPPAYAKKTRIPILCTLEVRMPKFAYCVRKKTRIPN